MSLPMLLLNLSMKRLLLYTLFASQVGGRMGETGDPEFAAGRRCDQGEGVTWVRLTGGGGGVSMG